MHTIFTFYVVKMSNFSIIAASLKNCPMTIGQNMQLNIDRLIAYFGGVNALAEALKQQDPENAASTAAIYKWRVRCRSPSSTG